ncbi:solute carrier family 52, riboflavin transporter, member 3-B-like [Manduca sexta]|uniref:solute carrier family 52, riboflavin transporter, member 3-B-like n=1 Tax=Manduca sexta TaxID=7130 RepID=UPI00188FBA12|nr:solute carrier family 52, riboflavin transporter, member 3-B-like [Manduca sexta]
MTEVGKRQILLDGFLMCWGMGTWLGVNGIFVQLPLLVEQLPEGWALPTSMVLFVQFANLGPITYGLLRRFLPNGSDRYYIFVLLTTGMLALTLNAFLYDRTAMIGSTERSVAFLLLTFFTALVGCTSSVLFYPYMRTFRDMYLATYLVGEGLSGFIPSILALIQGVNGEPECLPSEDGTSLVPHFPPPLFSSTVFLLLLASLAAISLISFININFLKRFDSERVSLVPVSEEADKEVQEKVEQESFLSRRWLSVMLFMIVLNAFNNGVLPSIQSYSCMPYGTRAYHLSVTLGNMANPTACLAGIWLKPMPVKFLAAMLTVNLVPMGYLVATALLSPAPPLQNEVIGEILIVFCWTMVYAVVSYARMWVYGWARRGGARGMRVIGGVTQLGSASGSMVLFVLVNFTNLFTQPERCPAISKIY